MVGLNIPLRSIFKPSYSPHCINTNVMHNAAGQSSDPRIGTFACRTFHRDTKASKRANLPARDNELKLTTKE
jgi:hypothetical protein